LEDIEPRAGAGWVAPPLREAEVARDPITQFAAWLAEARAVERSDPTALALATATPDGQPSVRMVLLKGFDERGFVFYTNYESRKGRELAANPRAALAFYWPELRRQVRVEGRVEPVAPEDSDAYFRSRPRGSQIAAAASPQSRVVPDRETLERWVAELTERYAAGPVPRPAYWGGYRVVPTAVEFWQSRPNRLHDRLRYVRRPDGSWQIERLAP
jgi:pyridoxamine 5'-phosphate oxidase